MADSLKDQKKTLREIRDLTRDFQAGLIDSKKAVEKMEQSMDAFGDATTKASKAVKQKLQTELKSLQNAAEDIQTTFSEKGINQEGIIGISDIFKDQFDKITGFIEKLPFGDKLKEIMQIDEIGETFKTQIGGAIERSIDNGKVEWKLFGAAGGKALKSLGAGMMKYLVNPWFIVAALATVAIARFVKFDSVMGDIRDKTGFTGEQMREITENVAGANLNLAKFGVTMKQAAESAAAINETFSNMVFLTTENIETVTMISKALGVGAGEAAKMFQTFLNMAGGSAEIAKNMIATTKATAEAVGVSPQLVFQDIASASEKIFEVTNGLPDTIARTAIEARRLGLNLDEAVGIAENLMNFESSIESQMNAMVLTGRNLNLEQARFLAATGETDKMLVEISKQFGGFKSVI